MENTKPAYTILFQDKNLAIVNKLGYYPVQTDKQGNKGLLDMLRENATGTESETKLEHYQLPHRIDQPVTGIVVLAKTQETQARLSQMFQEGKIGKRYWAVTSHAPQLVEGKARHYLVHNSKTNKVTAYDEKVPNSKEATLIYKQITSSDRYHFLEIQLFTGRHHQIRAQLAKLGCPIKGDLKYGDKRSNVGGGIMLHAHEIKFRHPITNELVHLTAPPPEGNILWKFLLEQLNS